MKVQHFKELIVWQKAMDLVEMIYLHTGRFPKEEIYGLTSQLRRAGVSVPSNIAESQKRHTTRDFVHFLAISQGSLAEIETQILIAQRLHYLNDAASAALLERLWEVGRLLAGLVKSLQPITNH